MKTPLDISDTEIMRIANNSFRRSFVELNFIPVGEASWLYRAKERDGKLYVIKIQRNVEAAPSEVLAQLVETKYKWVPGSVLTANSMLWARDMDYFFSVQRYIGVDDLHHAASEPEEKYLHELGIALSELHTLSLDETKLPNVHREDFQPEVFQVARVAIENLYSDTSGNTSITKVRQVFEKQSSSIEQLFENAATYGNALRNDQRTMPVVHGDMHFGNVLKPRNDHLYLIDWDHTMFDLPEMDLMYFTDKQIMEISKTYGKNLLENRTAIQYYRNFLLIRAIEFFLDRLLSPQYFGNEDIVTSLVEIFDMSPYMQRALTKH